MGTSGRVGRPLGGDSGDTLGRILAAARTHFAVSGYRSTTNKVIADDVGITPGALYHYIPSKAALYAEVYRDTVDYVYSEFERAALEEGCLLDRYRAVLRRAAELHATDATLTGFIVAVGQETQRHPDLIALLGDQRRRHIQFFAWLVDTAVESGELADPAGARAVADLLGATLTGLARLAVSTGDQARYSDAIDAMSHLLAGTLLTDSNA
ncbi:MAG TPA: TetR/AcrR family transcriptional regulator [Ilumatobacter sp.]|nr:TetR/AcrR family transcriptional regulator [Ilumatobacter sp.]